MNTAQLLSQVQHLASFCVNDNSAAALTGGNPAGVLFCKEFPADELMLAVAAGVGYSETVYAVVSQDSVAVRYFSPVAEVPFCGHATVALGHALREKHGAKQYRLRLNIGDIQLNAEQEKIQISSPPTKQTAIDPARVAVYLQHTNIEMADLQPNITPLLANAGNNHLVLCLNERKTLTEFAYDFEPVRRLMLEDNILTLAIMVFADNADATKDAQHIYIRNPFAAGNVYEDPATGAAAAAVSGWIRDQQIMPVHRLVFYQGEEMGVPCLLETQYPSEKGAPIQLAGTVRVLKTTGS